MAARLLQGSASVQEEPKEMVWMPTGVVLADVALGCLSHTSPGPGKLLSSLPECHLGRVGVSSGRKRELAEIAS